MRRVVDFLKHQKALALAHRTNMQGKRVKGKFLIIESDDWGALRTPSKAALEAFSKKGLDIKNSAYKNDSLASTEDLELLFNLLKSFRDQHGNPLKITANTIMANPDFEKIRESNFSQFFFEDFRDTLQRYPAHHNAFLKWKQGIAEGLFMPQFHGREHLQYKRWFKVLRSGDPHALFTFDWGTTYSGKGDYSFMGAYDWDQQSDVEDHKAIVAEGLSMFENVFGFASQSFIAPCYCWDNELLPVLKSKSVKILQGRRSQLLPTGSHSKYKTQSHHFGETDQFGLKYNIRNCFLEPSTSPNKDWVDSCLAQIEVAFRWDKPAVICSHRLNYIGFINPRNRERGLKDLTTVIQKVQKKWPDVRFISTDQLENLL